MAAEGSGQEDVGLETCITVVNVEANRSNGKIVNIFSSRDPRGLPRMKLWLRKITRVVHRDAVREILHSVAEILCHKLHESGRKRAKQTALPFPMLTKTSRCSNVFGT